MNDVQHHLISEDYARAIATVIAQRVSFYVGDGGFVQPQINTQADPPKRVITVVERLWCERDGRNCKRFLAVFKGGWWVKLELRQYGPILAINPPLLGSVTAHAQLQCGGAADVTRPSKGQAVRWQTWTFGEYLRDFPNGDTPQLRALLQPFVPNFQVYYERAAKQAER